MHGARNEAWRLGAYAAVVVGAVALVLSYAALELAGIGLFVLPLVALGWTAHLSRAYARALHTRGDLLQLRCEHRAARTIAILREMSG